MSSIVWYISLKNHKFTARFYGILMTSKLVLGGIWLEHWLVEINVCCIDKACDGPAAEFSLFLDLIEKYNCAISSWPWNSFDLQWVFLQMSHAVWVQGPQRRWLGGLTGMRTWPKLSAREVSNWKEVEIRMVVIKIKFKL